MADDVEIRGGGDLDGAVLRNAATEVTLKRLADSFDKKFGTGASSKLFETNEKAIKGNVAAMQSSASISNAYSSTLSKLNQTSDKLTKGFSQLGTMAVGGLFSGIANAGKMLLGFFTESLDSFRQTSQVGASFNNDLVELRRAAAASAMPLDMFTETISKNSQLLAAFGGTVTQGAHRFGELSKEIRTSEMGRQFMGMGMTMSELNDYMAGYLELEMKANRLEGRSDAQLIQGTNNYIMELDKLTKITGLSRQQQAEATRTAMKDGRLLFLQNRLTGKAAEQFQTSVGLMQSKFDPQVMGTMTNMMMGIVEPGDRFGEMLIGTVPGIMQFSKAVAEGKVSTEDQISAYKDQKKAIDARLALYTPEVIASNEALRKMQEYSAGLSSLINANAGAAKAEQDRRSKITTALGSLAQTFEKIKGDIMVSLIDSGVFKKITDGLEGLAGIFLDNIGKVGPRIAKMIGEFDQVITRFLDKVNTDGIASAIGDFLKGLLAKIFGKTSPEQDVKLQKNAEQLSTNTQEQGRLRARMKELQSGKQTDETVKELINVQKQLDALTETRKTLVAENTQIQDSMRQGLFSFDWSTLGSALKAVADAAGPVTLAIGGLVAMAVAIPASAAAKLLAIGAAVGITTGGIGFLLQGVASIIEQSAKALDMMPTSLKKFEELDAERLKIVGPALAELTKPLMQAGLAGLLSSIGGDGLPKLADSIRKFEDVDPSKIREVGPALEILNRGLDVLTGGGKGGVLQAFTGAIARFLTGDNGIGQFADSFKKFNDIDANNIKNLVSGLDDIKTKIGEDFTNQAKNVDTFATSIKNLRKDLEALKTTLESLNKGTGVLGGGPSALSQVASQVSQIGGGGAGGATNAMLEEQRKLNTLITELKPVFEATRDNTKDTADGVSGRRSLTER